MEKSKRASASAGIADGVGRQKLVQASENGAECFAFQLVSLKHLLS
jgi:hypothetical protein